MKKKRISVAWRLSVPSLLLILTVTVFPIIYTGYISLTNMNLYHWNNYHIIGFGNYIKALFSVESGFPAAVVTTIIWTAVNMALQIVLGFIIALGLNAPGLKAGRVYKTLLMFPWAMPAYVSILIWRTGIYNPQFGLANKFLRMAGVGSINFLSRNVPAFFSCTALNLWMALPFMIVMFDGALQSIDRSYYESAMMDGAGFMTKTLRITVPLVRPVMAPAVIMTTFTTFKQFDIVYLLTQQKGSLTGATLQTIITYAHENAFVTNNYGLSSAVSILIFVLIIIISLYVNRGLKEEAG